MEGKEEKMEGGGKVRREKRKWEGDGRVEEGNGEKPPKTRFGRNFELWGLLYLASFTNQSQILACNRVAVV